MKSFITFEEKSLNLISDEELIQLYLSLNICGLETALHENLLDINRYKSIFKSAFKNNMKLNFHTPDFIDPYNFDLKYFKENTSFKQSTDKYFDTILDMLQSCSDSYNPIITFHGASVEFDDFDKAREMTERYCDYTLNLIEKRKLPFILAIESLNSTKKPVFGGSKDELISLVNKFDSPRLQICWDMVHDYLGSADNYSEPDEVFLDNVSNVHIHGFSSIEDTPIEHTPLHQSTINYDNMFKSLEDFGYSGPITNELLWFGSKDYLSDLKNDSYLLNEMIKNIKK